MDTISPQLTPPKPLLVMKFGGTSVGTAAAMEQAAEIVRGCRTEWQHIVVVTSALNGVTDLLLDSARQAAQGDLEILAQARSKLRRLHHPIAEALLKNPARNRQVKQEVDELIAGFASLCQAIAVLGETTPRALDTVAPMGERMCVRLLAAALEERGVPAQYVEATRLIVTDSHFQAAHPDFPATVQQTRHTLGPILAAGQVPVVTGFLGANLEGVATTLGRGGSDYSAALLGAALPASEVWIWTDVDGVMSADPRLVPEARTIPELTYREIAELAYFGAKVLHPKAIRPVIEAGIGLRICNTFNPGHPGTRLVAETVARQDGQVKAVTAIKGQRLITVEGRGMLGVPGVAARTFAAVASTGVSVPLITQASSEQSICFAVPSESAGSVVAALEAAFAHELGTRDIDRIWATGETVIITLVGAGMRHTPGIAGKIFSALGNTNTNIVAIAQGSSEVSISLVVEASDAEPAVTALHQLIVD
jgi:bifunctional aspartokinase / homoserine dehydrogenase 1